MKLVTLPADVLKLLLDALPTALPSLAAEAEATANRLLLEAPEPYPADSVLFSRLERPLVIYDVETTGVNVVDDRICSLAWLLLTPEGEIQEGIRYFNPEKKLTQEVIDIHGLTNEFLADYDNFESQLDWLLNVFGPNVDVAHFNGNSFDVQILSESFGRYGVTWPLPGMNSLDASVLFRKSEGRSLADAHKFYLGHEMTGNHEARADVRATFNVLKAMLVRYPLFQDATVGELHLASMFDPNAVDLAGKLTKNGEGEICYNFGKNKGLPVMQDSGYGLWMLSADFPSNTKAWLNKILYGY